MVGVVGRRTRRAPNSLRSYGTVLSLAYVSTFLVFPHCLRGVRLARRWRGGAILHARRHMCQSDIDVPQCSRWPLERPCV